MNQQQLLQLCSWIATTLGGLAVSKGWLSSDQVTLVAGFLASAAALGWSIYQSREKGQIASTAKIDGVGKIIMNDSKVADSIPSPKVVGN